MRMKWRRWGKLLQALLERFGSTASDADLSRDCNRMVAQVLNREVDITAISALGSALEQGGSTNATQDDQRLAAQTVIAFDTNVFLRLSGHQKADDVVDFLRTSFHGKLLLPGQAIQEFWNNQLNAVETVASSIKKHSDNLRKEIEKIDPSYGDFAVRFRGLLDEFQASYGYLYDEATLRRLKLIVGLLSEKALIPYCPRTELSSIALVRRRTKTPPGFKDDLDGDFFLWADLLLGVATLLKEGFSPLRVALVSNDAKVDWIRHGVPHPILSAEMKALCGAAFQIWSLDDLANLIPA